MASGGDVLNMLLPDGKYVIYGDDYENITWFDDNKITKKEFEAGFDKYDAWKVKQDSDKAAERQAILDRIGLTAEELQTIIG